MLEFVEAPKPTARSPEVAPAVKATRLPPGVCTAVSQADVVPVFWTVPPVMEAAPVLAGVFWRDAGTVSSDVDSAIWRCFPSYAAMVMSPIASVELSISPAPSYVMSVLRPSASVMDTTSPLAL